MMKKFKKYVTAKKFVVDASGATLVEYGVALLVVIIVGATAISALGTAVGNEISSSAEAF
ncbi:Flp family type IVb pilin [Boseongicola aestuarii]|uniref:Flp/Fap pilin component n=1 Tax=Boseongicola aestuarii TaxID=1470561 RepID=A0A238IWH9_9RHOB|nr:hypothetical protein [Boseongicola aestuarii]SMX22044.1 hypothetical protein BOA8489_00131 [Boseongicola aestuarii]